MNKRLIAAAAIVLTILALSPAHPALAATGSNICKGTTSCTISEVGPFMQHISAECGNLGTCALADIQAVFENVAYYILEIIGAVVFLMYVIGGMFFLASGFPGQEKLREKGKKALQTSTVGLIIVFSAFAFMHTLYGVLTGSGIGGNYVSCYAPIAGVTQPKEACAENSYCSDDGLCLSLCEITYSVSDEGTKTSHACVDTDGSQPLVLPADSTATCEKNLCPGGNNQQCCAFTSK